MITFTRILFVAIALTFVFALFSVEIKDPDFWWHLKTGDYIVEHGSIPTIDPFAYTSTPKDPLSPESVRIRFILAQYWVAQVLFSKIFSAFGFQGIISLRALILTLLVFVVYRGIRREGLGFHLAIALTVPIVMIVFTFTGERPQLFSFLFFALIVFLVEGFRNAEIRRDSSRLAVAELGGNSTQSAPRDQEQNALVTNPPSAISPLPSRRVSKRSILYLIPIPLVMIAWANMHGGYIVGIALSLCYLTIEWLKYALLSVTRIHFPFVESTTLSLPKLRLFSAVIGLSILVTLINPNTYKVVPFLVELEGGLYKSFIIETMSPIALFRSGFYEIQFFLLFGLLAVGTLLIVISIRRADPTDIVIFAGLAAASLSIARFIPYFSPVSVLLTARYGVTILHRLPKIVEKIGKQIEIPLNAFVIVVLVLMLINGDLFKSGVRPNKYPEGAATFLRENRVQGNMFNPYVWGGYLIWALYPEYKVFVDGRGLIPEVFFQEVRVLEASPLPVRNLPEWKAILDAYRVQCIVTFSVGNFTGRLVPLIPALLNESEWHLVYMDNISLIFVRDSAENREIIDRYGIPKEWLWNEVAVEAALKLKDAPNRANYYETMGDAFFMKGSLREARDAYAKALALSPRSARLRSRVEHLDALIRLQNR